MKNVMDKYRNIIIAITATIGLVCTLYAGTCFLIDARAEKVTKKATDPLIKEIQYINCNLRAMLTDEQQKEADALYKAVIKIGEK